MPYKDKEKQRQAQRDWARRNRGTTNKNRKLAKQANKDRVKKIKSENPCSDCGHYFHFAAMHFDHTSDNKFSHISRMVAHNAWPAIEKEIEKCDLVCANCHAVRTYNRIMESTAEVVGSQP